MKLKITDRAKAEFAFYRDTPLDMIGYEVGVHVSEAPDAAL